MADNKCNPCKDSVFKSLSSNPDLADIVDLIAGGLQNVEVVGDDAFIFVEESEVDGKTRFKVRYEPYVPLSVSMGNNVNGLQLLGTTVNDITLNWSYNKPVEFQQLSRSGVGNINTPSVTSATSYSKVLTGQNITSNTTYTISGDDILSDNKGSKSASTGVTFGNLVYFGTVDAPSTEAITPSFVQGLDLTPLSTSLRTNRNISFTSQSLTGQNDIVLVPKRYELNSGQQFIYNNGINKGAFTQNGEVSITNPAGFPEIYDIWVSFFQGIGGLQFTIS